MEERYIRNIGALSESDCACLGGKRAFVAGCGGLGGYITDMLLRLGLGFITVADGDVFELSNLNRQLLSDINVIGESKAKVAERYAAKVNPHVCFKAYDGYITEENVSHIIAGSDVVLDALDSIEARKLLKAECDRQNIPYIYGAVKGWAAQAAVSLPKDGLLDTLYTEGTSGKGESTLPFTPALCAAIQCSLCVKLLCGKEVERGRLYLFDLLDCDFAKLP